MVAITERGGESTGSLRARLKVSRGTINNWLSALDIPTQKSGREHYIAQDHVVLLEKFAVLMSMQHIDLAIAHLYQGLPVPVRPAPNPEPKFTPEQQAIAAIAQRLQEMEQHFLPPAPDPRDKATQLKSAAAMGLVLSTSELFALGVSRHCLKGKRRDRGFVFKHFGKVGREYGWKVLEESNL